jgi:phosphoribosylformylglycinamidine synthase
MAVTELYSTQGLEVGQEQRLLRRVQELGVPVTAFSTEFCFNVASSGKIAAKDLEKIKWCLAEGGHTIGDSSRLRPSGHDFVIEVGPRMNFTTAWSTNCVSVLRAAEVESVSRLERSRRFLVSSAAPLSKEHKATLVGVLHDRMTEMVYDKPISSFESGITPKPIQWVPVMKEGRAALEKINSEMGLGFDEWDYEYYLNLFAEDLKRDPSDCELFDLAQSNSEHSRHWFFSGKMVIDGQEKEESLFKIVKETLTNNPNSNKNGVISFHDNSSTITGAKVPMLVPSYYTGSASEPGKPAAYTTSDVEMDLLLTCETHNMPTGICPFAGAETGTGGRLRDVQCTGIGASYVAGTIGYCVGALNLPHDKKPYEDPTWSYPSAMASPANILIEGSNGCSDYGNKFGEPLICGFTRSFGLRTAGGERREWIKPILFTGGFGQMDSKHRKKLDPEVGMKVVKLGGPAYRIGMGGGSASSRADGDSRTDLDFNAVQRGDAEMEQKMNRVIRACCELGDKNPFVQLHDQGCGGNCNVLKEVLDPIGGKIDIREIILGDPTMSVLEIWGAEYQEANCCLVREGSLPLLKQIAERERSSVSCVGEITGDGCCTVVDKKDGSTPVKLPLAQVLGKLPPKTFKSNRADLVPAADSPGVMHALFGRSDATVLPVTLGLVLSNVTVGSKRFLTNKVDRSVTGLVAQQQCVGPLLTPLADCAVIAHSMLTPDGTPVRGGVTAIGEQPIKGLLSGPANARMSVGEALTNIVWAKCTALGDIKCSANWMWASKLPGEGTLMYDTALALREVMHILGVSIDGGKDSLSMFARTDTKELVKSPGELTISLYCSVSDVTMTVTPDLKRPASRPAEPAAKRARAVAADSALLLVQIAGTSAARLGGSVAASCYGRLGDVPPDCEKEAAESLKKAFNVTQDLIAKRQISAGHDRSDGGLASAVLEMAFAGNCGVTLDVSAAEVAGQTTLEALFHEELGLILEVATADVAAVTAAYTSQGVSCVRVGTAIAADKVTIVGKSGQVELEAKMTELRDKWESSSFALEMLQTNPACVEQERDSMAVRSTPPIHATILNPQPQWQLTATNVPKVGILREEGSNGDREMAAAFRLAGFESWDLTMTDLAKGSIGLDQFRGLAFVGGFSYADTLGSAKGWAATCKFQPAVVAQLKKFYERKDTFSLGVCNGCQLLHRLQWVPFGPGGVPAEEAPRLAHNDSARFESRFINLRVGKTNSMWFQGMEGSVLGVWSAHGEGKFEFPNPALRDRVEREGLVPLHYVDDQGRPTSAYPYCPNGSPGGIAGMTTADGRHLALMPHPERSVLKWQLPWMPNEWSKEGPQAAPWLQLFINARRFCD